MPTIYVWEVLLCIGALVYLFYKWTTSTYKTFEGRGIRYEKPFPFVGNNLDIMLNRASLHKVMMDFHLRNKIKKITGYYHFIKPVYVINDPAYIKMLTVKAFENFPNHYTFFKTDEPLFKHMLIMMQDERWKNMRVALTPVFTAAKMRIMFGLMNECFAESMQHLSEKSTNGKGFDVDIKDVCNRLSNDLIASTAFGLKVNSFEDRNNKFYQIGSAVAFFRGTQMLKFLMANLSQFVFKLLGLRLIDAEKTEYFNRLVIDAMKYREEHKIVRPDMIQLLLEAKKESTKQWTDEEIVAQCFIFFFAAFENNANFICTTAYELAYNAEVQQQLYEEVKEVEKELDGKPLSYDVLGKMTYMDQVASESLRKWPLIAVIDRMCNKDYTLQSDDGNEVFDFKKGDMIFIPVSGLHWNPEYFPNPEVFDPSRFADENKDRIVPYSYLPFGVGPRSCIGNRYALMQAKAMLYYLLLNYKIEASSKTVKDLLATARGFQLMPSRDFWLRLEPRQ